MSVRSPIRRSLLRKIIWFGGDRRVVGFFGLLLFLLGVTMFMGNGFFYFLPLVVPGAIFVVVLWAAREANISDPWMIDVIFRQFKYRKYYAPKPDLGTEHPQVRDFS